MKTMHLPALLTLVALSLACGCATAPLTAPANEAVSTPPPASVSPSVAGRAPFLEMGEIRGLKGGKPEFVLYRNGLFEHKGEAIGTLKPDGRFLDLNGNLLVAMEPDGAIAFNGEVVTVAEDGTATVQKDPRLPVLRFDEAGNIVGGVNATQVQGLTPGLRRTAMFAVLLADMIPLLRSSGVR